MASRMSRRRQRSGSGLVGTGGRGGSEKKISGGGRGGSLGRRGRRRRGDDHTPFPACRPVPSHQLLHPKAERVLRDRNRNARLSPEQTRHVP